MLVIVLLVMPLLVGLVAYVVLGLSGRRPRSAEMAARGSSLLLPLYIRDYWDWMTAPVVRGLVRIRVSPDLITVVSLMAALAAALAFVSGRLGAGGARYLFSGSLDLFDGKVARASGRAGRAGAFLDSTLDRYGELVVLTALGWHFRGSSLLLGCLLALGGSLMVSYTRARGEGLGVSLRDGLMQRAERVVLLGLSALLVAPLANRWPTMSWERLCLGSALWMLALSSHVTAAGRFFAVWRLLRHLDASDGGPGVLRHPAAGRAAGEWDAASTRR